MTESFSVGFSTCDLIYHNSSLNRTLIYVLSADSSYELVDLRGNDYAFLAHTNNFIWAVDTSGEPQTIVEYSFSWLNSGIAQYSRTIDLVTNVCDIVIGLTYYTTNTLITINSCDSTIVEIDISTSTATKSIITDLPSGRDGTGNLIYSSVSGGKIISFVTRISDSTFWLIQYDKNTGYLELDLQLIFTNPTGLYLENNTIYLTNEIGNIYSVNSSTYSISFVGTLGPGNTLGVSQNITCVTSVFTPQPITNFVYGYVSSETTCGVPDSLLYSSSFPFDIGITLYTDINLTTTTTTTKVTYFTGTIGGDSYGVDGGIVEGISSNCSPSFNRGCTGSNIVITNRSKESVTVDLNLGFSTPSYSVTIPALTALIVVEACGFATPPPLWLRIT
jgi:hypothetical protein